MIMSVDRNIVRRWTLDISYELIEAEWRIYASLNWVIIGSDNGLLPVWHKAIICTNAGILLIGPLETSFSEILIGIQTFSFKKLHLKTSSAKWCLFCLSLNELRKYWQHPVQDNQCLERADHHMSSLSSSVKHPSTNRYTWHTPSVRLLDVNCISMHNSCKYPNQSTGQQEETHCLPIAFLIVNILGFEWDRNIIVTVISDHLNHAQGCWLRLVYFSFTNWKQRPNGPCDCCNCTYHVNRATALALEI